MWCVETMRFISSAGIGQRIKRYLQGSFLILAYTGSYNYISVSAVACAGIVSEHKHHFQLDCLQRLMVNLDGELMVVHMCMELLSTRHDYTEHAFYVHISLLCYS